jgi:hypothetical protein
MTTTRKSTRKATPPRALPPGYVARLHATTALSRILRGEAENAPEALAHLDEAELATLAGAGALLAALARSVMSDREREHGRSA